MPAAEIGKVTQKYDGSELELRPSYIHLSPQCSPFLLKHSFAGLSFSRIRISGKNGKALSKPRFLIKMQTREISRSRKIRIRETRNRKL